MFKILQSVIQVYGSSLNSYAIYAVNVVMYGDEICHNINTPVAGTILLKEIDIAIHSPNQRSIHIAVSVSGRKRCGGGSAHDDFLLTRLVKLQQRGLWFTYGSQWRRWYARMMLFQETIKVVAHGFRSKCSLTPMVRSSLQTLSFRPYSMYHVPCSRFFYVICAFTLINW